MKDRTQGNETNDDISLQAETLIDLPVREGQASEISGGAGQAGQTRGDTQTYLSWQYETYNY